MTGVETASSLLFVISIFLQLAISNCKPVTPELFNYYWNRSQSNITLAHIMSDNLLPKLEQCFKMNCNPTSFLVHKLWWYRCFLTCLLFSHQSSTKTLTNQNSSHPTLNLTEMENIRKSLGEHARFINDENGDIIGIDVPDEREYQNRSGASSVSGATGHNMMASVLNEPPSMLSLNGNSLDADVCCKTEEKFYRNASLTDVSGVHQTLAQKQNIGIYQFIRHGVCGPKASCTGECVQRHVTMSLFTYSPTANQKIGMSFFEIPGYCSCIAKAT